MGNERLSVQPELTDEQQWEAELLQANFGLSWEEGQQIIEAGPYKGTLSQMLQDPKCPVGPSVRDAYHNPENGGIEAVQQKLDSFAAIFPNFSANVGERFAEAEAKKKLNQPN